MYMHYHFKQISSDINRLKDNITGGLNWLTQVVSNTVTPLASIKTSNSSTNITSNSNSNANSNSESEKSSVVTTASTSVSSSSTALTSSIFAKVLTVVKPPVNFLSSSSTVAVNSKDEKNDEGKVQAGEGYDENPAASVMLGLDNPADNITSTTVSPTLPNREYTSPSTYQLPDILLNNEDRLDYTLQESILENTTNYLAAMTAHSSYFENKDVAM